MKNLENRTSNELGVERTKKEESTLLQNTRVAVSNCFKVASYALCYGGLAAVPLSMLAAPFYMENHETLAIGMPLIAGFVLCPLGYVSGILAEAIGLPRQHSDNAPWNAAGIF